MTDLGLLHQIRDYQFTTLEFLTNESQYYKSAVHAIKYKWVEQLRNPFHSLLS